MVVASCGSTAGTTAGDTDALKEAIERRVSEPATTTEPTHVITADDIADIYAVNGPGIGFDAGDIGEGDLLVIETSCFLLVEASDEAEVALVHDSFDSWFTGQLLAAGAPMEFIETWDPRGMLDDLVDLGCAPGAASPPTVANG